MNVEALSITPVAIKECPPNRPRIVPEKEKGFHRRWKVSYATMHPVGRW
jgi:hypothetical protein